MYASLELGEKAKAKATAKWSFSRRRPAVGRAHLQSTYVSFCVQGWALVLALPVAVYAGSCYAHASSRYTSYVYRSASDD